MLLNIIIQDSHQLIGLKKMSKYIHSVCVLLLLSGYLLVAGCANHGIINGNTLLPVPSLTTTSSAPDTSPLPQGYNGAFIPAREGQGPADIWLVEYECIPNVLMVKMGTTVTWTSFDFKPLTIVSDAGLFASNIEPARGTFSYLFDYPGTFGYSIDPYSGCMGGAVIVVE